MKGQKPTGWTVLKFGGTSVSTRERWDTILAVLRRRLAEPVRPLVVCSAVAGVSDKLERLLIEAVAGRHQPILEEIVTVHRELAASLGIDETPLAAGLEELERLATGVSLIEGFTPKLRARVMAQGELLSTRLGAAFLDRCGLHAAWLDARECLMSVVGPGVGEERRYLSATCAFEPDPALRARLDATAEPVVVTQGFIARDPRGDTVLLGRGGSDTSAAYFAAKLQAQRCEIWTDVPGIYTANPRQVPSARMLRELDYDEAQEVATMGAKVLHPRCIAPVRAQDIPLHIFSTVEPDMVGTRISREGAGGGPRVKAISAKSGVTLVSMETLGMWQQVGFLADTFACFKALGLSIDLVSTSEANVTVSLDRAANTLDDEVLAGLLESLRAHCRASLISGCSAVSLIGRDIRAVLHRLGPVLGVFEAQRVHLVSQAASDLNLTFVVDQEQEGRLVRELHALLFEGTVNDPLFGPTWQELRPEAVLAEEATPVPWWHRRRDDLLALAASESPLYVYDEESLRRAAAEVGTLRSIDRVLYSVKANDHPDVVAVFEQAGLGFECVSVGELECLLGRHPNLDPGRILFTPNFVPRCEYERARELGAMLTLDNLHPLVAWPEVFEGADLFVRIDPGEGRGHHDHVRTAGAVSKFGVSVDQLDELMPLLEAARARVVGLHAHVGSGIRNPENWSELALFLASVAERFPDVRVLDLGGGLGVPEKPGQTALDLAALDDGLARFRSAWSSYDLWLEPGRFLVARAGVLLARVTQVKRKGAVHYVGIETGMNSLIRPALYGAYHEIANLTRLGEPATTLVNVVGPICETGDTLGYGRPLPPTQEGEILLIATAGAYGRVMSSRYNSREPAAERVLAVR